MLQRLCEDNEYNDLIVKASAIDDSCLRMCYVAAWGISPYSATQGRLKKPFNPILGESFEYIPPDNSYRYVGEQVSHHPPISAGYCEAPQYVWWADAGTKTQFWGTSIEVVQHCSKHLIIKNHKDRFTLNKPRSAVNNLIVGAMYIDHYGDVPCINHNTGDTAMLTLNKQGWTSKGAFEINGWVKDKTGKLRYTLKGKWNEGMKAIDEITKQEILIWQKYPNISNLEEQYCFTNYTIQMNHLNAELIVKLPISDCRFRPDQRGLEYGNIELAISEKFRLEEKQRTRRKELQAKGEGHRPRWFKEIIDQITGLQSYEYLGGYWEAREKGVWEHVLDLYS